jgi:hypothetical protein
VPDGCGGVVQCGSCAAGQGCGSDKQCRAACGPNGSTLACLQAQDKTTTTDPTLVCSTCVANSGCLDPLAQGGTCESTLGNASLLAGALPDGKSCAQAFSPLTTPVSETAVCLDVLGTIFTSKCAAGLQETPCACGTTDVASCLAGTVVPNGAAFDAYACDFNGAGINTVSTDFTVQAFGAGQANALVQCAAINGCDCF